MKNKYFCWLFLLFALISAGANAQVKVEGSVFDEMDNPLIGVSVFTENRKAGTVTDVDGHFSISVPNTREILTFSYVGYTTQKVTLKGRKLLKVVLKEDSELLDEVVVVGYGTQKKGSVTGAISQVGNKELKMAPSGSLSNMLAGRLPGLITKQSSGQPGQDGSSLYIRGNGAGDGDPLIVVDGVVTDLFSLILNKNEVESITYLEGCYCSCCIWCARCCRCYFGDYETWYSTEAYGYREFFGYFKSEYKFSGIPKWSRFCVLVQYSTAYGWSSRRKFALFR